MHINNIIKNFISTVMYQLRIYPLRFHLSDIYEVRLYCSSDAGLHGYAPIVVPLYRLKGRDNRERRRVIKHLPNDLTTLVINSHSILLVLYLFLNLGGVCPFLHLFWNLLYHVTVCLLRQFPLLSVPRDTLKVVKRAGDRDRQPVLKNFPKELIWWEYLTKAFTTYATSQTDEFCVVLAYLFISEICFRTLTLLREHIGLVWFGFFEDLRRFSGISAISRLGRGR